MGANSQQSLIDVEHLYVARGGNPVLRDVGLTLHTGEIVAVVGGNGSGKSTLINAVVKLLPFQEGSIKIFDTPLRQFRHWHRIGYVPQQATLHLPNATVREIVEAGRLPHRKPFVPLTRDDRRAIDEALAQVELTDRARWPFTALSGGQKQRALIARALCTEPDLFIMDEPMAGVDLHSQAGLAQLLGTLVRDGKRGLLVVLHELGSIPIDHRVTLCDGRVVEPQDQEVPAPHAPHTSDPILNKDRC